MGETLRSGVLPNDAKRSAPGIATYTEVKRQTMALSSIASSMLAIAATITLLGGPAAAEPVQHCESNIGSPDNLKALKHGLVEGYLPQTSLPNSLELLPAPPARSSTAYTLDVETAEASFPLRGTPRWDLAARDANLNFPAAASIFSCALGVPISKKETPRLYTLLHRTLTDAGLATYRAKNHYQRPRPFTVNNQPMCTPEDDELLRNDGSYPSGHTAAGWAWALVLSEVSPERRDQLVARGIEYGKSRSICNVHWLSDVQASQIIGSAAVAQLHTDPVFRADLRAAALEVKALREQGRRPDDTYCSLEIKALKP